jgi:uncharacterized protein GlcG (DUF336 family)
VTGAAGDLGFPIRSHGVLLGGIGVSGASSQEDAQLGLDALESGGFETQVEPNES